MSRTQKNFGMIMLILIALTWGVAIPAARAANTQPGLKDTDGDHFIDGPDRVVVEDGRQWIYHGEDKNGNGKWDRAGADGILGTTDDETDPNNSSSHPNGPFREPVTASSVWIPEAGMEYFTVLLDYAQVVNPANANRSIGWGYGRFKLDPVKRMLTCEIHVEKLQGGQELTARLYWGADQKANAPADNYYDLPLGSEKTREWNYGKDRNGNDRNPEDINRFVADLRAGRAYIEVGTEKYASTDVSKSSGEVRGKIVQCTEDIDNITYYVCSKGGVNSGDSYQFITGYLKNGQESDSWIEPGDGSKVHPWRTISHALKISMLNPYIQTKTKVRIYVGEGTYSESLKLPNSPFDMEIKGGYDRDWTWNPFLNQTILKPPSDECGVDIYQSRVFGGFGELYIHGMIIDGIDTASEGGQTASAISVVKNNNMFITNCELRNFKKAGINAIDTIVKFHNNIIDNCSCGIFLNNSTVIGYQNTIVRNSYGIYIMGMAQANYICLKNNIIANNANTMFSLSDQSVFSRPKNLIEYNDFYPMVSGISGNGNKSDDPKCGSDNEFYDGLDDDSPCKSKGDPEFDEGDCVNLLRYSLDTQGLLGLLEKNREYLSDVFPLNNPIQVDDKELIAIMGYNIRENKSSNSVTADLGISGGFWAIKTNSHGGAVIYDPIDKTHANIYPNIHSSSISWKKENGKDFEAVVLRTKVDESAPSFPLVALGNGINHPDLLTRGGYLVYKGSNTQLEDPNLAPESIYRYYIYPVKNVDDGSGTKFKLFLSPTTIEVKIGEGLSIYNLLNYSCEVIALNGDYGHNTRRIIPYNSNLNMVVVTKGDQGPELLVLGQNNETYSLLPFYSLDGITYENFYPDYVNHVDDKQAGHPGDIINKHDGIITSNDSEVNEMCMLNGIYNEDSVGNIRSNFGDSEDWICKEIVNKWISCGNEMRGFKTLRDEYWNEMLVAHSDGGLDNNKLASYGDVDVDLDINELASNGGVISYYYTYLDYDYNTKRKIYRAYHANQADVLYINGHGSRFDGAVVSGVPLRSKKGFFEVRPTNVRINDRKGEKSGFYNDYKTVCPKDDWNRDLDVVILDTCGSLGIYIPPNIPRIQNTSIYCPLEVFMIQTDTGTDDGGLGEEREYISAPGYLTKIPKTVYRLSPGITWDVTLNWKWNKEKKYYEFNDDTFKITLCGHYWSSLDSTPEERQLLYNNWIRMGGMVNSTPGEIDSERSNRIEELWIGMHKLVAVKDGWYYRKIYSAGGYVFEPACTIGFDGYRYLTYDPKTKLPQMIGPINFWRGKKYKNLPIDKPNFALERTEAK